MFFFLMLLWLIRKAVPTFVPNKTGESKLQKLSYTCKLCSRRACICTTGLPDGFFSNKNPNLCFFGGSSNGKCWLFYVHLVNFPAIWHILWPFGIYFPHFGTFLPVL
jgi:hypothetical protein